MDVFLCHGKCFKCLGGSGCPQKKGLQEKREQAFYAQLDAIKKASREKMFAEMEKTGKRLERCKNSL